MWRSSQPSTAPGVLLSPSGGESAQALAKQLHLLEMATAPGMLHCDEPMIPWGPTPPSSGESAQALAKQLHLLEMATWPVCVEMAHAMTAAGVPDFSVFRGLSLEAIDGMLSCYPFSGIHIRRIHTHVNNVST